MRPASASFAACISRRYSAFAGPVAERVQSFGDTVWTEFTPLAIQHDAVNLSQGLPTVPVDDFVLDALSDVTKPGMWHQYTRPAGHPALVEQLAKHYSNQLEHDLDPMEHVLVTTGATQAIFLFFQTFVQAGDEVIVIEPFYDSYAPQIQMAGGTPVFVPLTHQSCGPEDPQGIEGARGDCAQWSFDVSALKAAFGARTKAIVLNSPHNPTGRVFSAREMEVLCQLCQQHDVLVLADEVYDKLVYSPHVHTSIATLPEMWNRTVTLGSIGKAFNCTGWKVGWALGPEHLLRPMAVAQQYVPFCVSTPLQQALAAAFERAERETFFERQLSAFERRRDILHGALHEAGLPAELPQASYFMLADTSQVRLPAEYVSLPPFRRDYDFARWLTAEIGVACIPPSAFASSDSAERFGNFARFCFCKMDEDIEEAGRRLKRLTEFLQ